MFQVALELLQFYFFYRLRFVNEKQLYENNIYVPICHYNNEIGVKVPEYNTSTFCDPNAFQPTFNEFGMCWTFNNRRQGMDKFFLRNYANNTLQEDDASVQMNQTENNVIGLESPRNNTKEILKV